MGDRRVITTEAAPAALGPYSQAVAHGGLVFLSGQIALDPASGKLVEGDVAVQAEQVLDNLHQVLQAAGTSFDQVLRATIYLKDLNDFATVNEVYAKRFGGEFPARACVEVARLPGDVDVEISMIAAAPDAAK